MYLIRKVLAGVDGWLYDLGRRVGEALYEVVMFPLSKSLYSLVIRTPILGILALGFVDAILDFLSLDWPDRFEPGDVRNENGGEA